MDWRPSDSSQRHTAGLGKDFDNFLEGEDDLDLQLKMLDRYFPQPTSSQQIKAASNPVKQSALSEMQKRDFNQTEEPLEMSLHQYKSTSGPQFQTSERIAPKITSAKISTRRRVKPEKEAKLPTKLMRILVGSRVKDQPAIRNWLGEIKAENSQSKHIQVDFCGEPANSPQLHKYSIELSLLRCDGNWSREVKVYYLNGDIYSKEGHRWLEELEHDRPQNKLNQAKVIIVVEGVVAHILAANAKKDLGLHSSVSVSRPKKPLDIEHGIAQYGSAQLAQMLSKLKQGEPFSPRSSARRISDSPVQSGLFRSQDDLRDFIIRESVDHGSCGETFMDSLETEELLRSLTNSMLRSRKSWGGHHNKVPPETGQHSQTGSALSSESNSRAFANNEDSLGCSSRGRVFLKKQTEIQAVEDDLLSIESGGHKEDRMWLQSARSEDLELWGGRNPDSDEEELEVIMEDSQDHNERSPGEESMHSRSVSRPGTASKRHALNTQVSLSQQPPTTNSYWLAFLQCVPTVSEAKARGLAKVYKSGWELYDFLVKTESEIALKHLGSLPYMHQKKAKLVPLGKTSAIFIHRVFSSTDAFASLKPEIL